MPMLRTIKCDVENCECCETENDYGIGWKGWAIVQGMSRKIVDQDQAERVEDTQLTLCPEHRLMVAVYIEGLGG